MIQLFILLALLASPAGAVSPSASELARSIREAGLDPAECYRVRDLNFNREDVKYNLTDGFLIFSRPVAGRRLAAVFSADVEGGDAEVILMPPHRSERQSLGTYTGSPNLNEHFKTALFLMADQFGEQLLEMARAAGSKQEERGLLLAGQYTPVVRNISESLQMRLVEDLMNARGSTPNGALFYSALGGNKLGNFDVLLDPKSREQVLAGQLSSKGMRTVFDVWASFPSRSIRSGASKRFESPFKVKDCRIEATLDDALHMTAVTRVKVTPLVPMRAFGFQVVDRVTINEVRIDGKPVELFTSDSLRSAAIRGFGTNVFLVVAPEPLAEGQTVEVEFKHEGDVVVNAGNGVYGIGARGTWYPHRTAEFTNYDLTFRYPKRLTLVSTGEIVDERTEGDVRVTHRRTSSPVRFVGFNLGDFDRIAMNRSGYTIEVYGNRHIEPSLEAKPLLPPLQSGPPSRRRTVDLANVPFSQPTVTPGSRLAALADEVAGAFEFMTKQFGPPPLKTLTVSPIPGAFGQGFPGLVYLSTLSYIQNDQRPVGVRDNRKNFFSDVLAPHEVAHQWWGNLVTSESYQDLWLPEALATYSAILYLEKRKGAKIVESILDEYRTDLLGKLEDGSTVESIGPITWGARLESSAGAGAWRIVEYEKGAWIIHMLRLKLGDERFFKMLNELCRRYAFQPVSTDSFRSLAEEFLPPGGPKSLETFFENWVYGTGIPTLKLSSNVKGKAPALKITATVTQSGIDDDFTADVPVEIQFAGAPSIVKWVRTANEPVTITVSSKRLPSKIVIPLTSVLAKR